MERRYGRESGKYRAKINKTPKKTPFEKVLMRQSGFCAVLLAIGILVSYADAGNLADKYIKDVLYKSNSFSDWKNTFYPVFKAAEKGTKKTVAVMVSGVEYWDKKLGFNTEADNAPIKAKADKKTKKAEIAEKKTEVKEETVEEEKPLVFKIPTNGEITSAFGSRVQPVSGATSVHNGIDIAAPSGQTVISAAKGVVAATGYDDANGHYVVIKHTDEITSVYAHLSKICVTDNEIVDDNTKIGEVGSSGISTGPHLHFEIKVNQESVNPESYITLPHRNGV